MNKILLLLICSLICLNTVAQEFSENTIYIPPKIHEQFSLEPNMTIPDIAEILDIEPQRIFEYFRLNQRDSRINELSITNQNITLDDIYQLYNLDKYKFNDYSSLHEVSLLMNIPYKTIADYLGLEPQDAANRARPIRDFGLESIDMFEYEQRFQDEVLDFVSIIIVLGMIVVISALAMVAVVVSNLLIFDKKKTPQKVKIKTPIGTISTENTEHISLQDAVAAVTAAIHKFKTDIATDHKILLTYRRLDVSMWQASSKIEAPNRQYNMIKK